MESGLLSLVALFVTITMGDAASFSIFCDRTTGFEVREGGSRTIWSYRKRRTSNVAWTVTSPKGKVTPLGSCRGENCTAPLSPDIEVDPRVSRPDKSDLKIRNMRREYAGVLIFTETYENVQEFDNCTLSAYSSANVFNCGAQLHRSNWSAVGFCDVTDAYSTTGNYRYGVYVHLKSPEYRGIATGAVRRQENFNPAAYTDDLSGKEYYRTRLSYTFPLPKYDGNYSTETQTYPGSGRNQSEVFLHVENPTRPTHNCQNLIFIPENGEVPCVCSTESVGTPEGRLIWFSGDTVLAAGDYGVTQLQFPSNKVDRRHDGADIRCQLDWIVKRNVSVTTAVAYGPDRVDIVYRAVKAAQEGARAFIFFCSVTAVNPLTPVMIHWDGLCQGQTGFTCFVSMANSAVKEMEVSCTAVNAANNGRSASTSMKITAHGPAPGPPKEPSIATPNWPATSTSSDSEEPVFSDSRAEPDNDDSSSEMMTGVAIGSGAALGVLAAAVVVVVFVLRKRGCMPPYCRENKNTQGRPEQQAGMVPGLYEIPQRVSSEEGASEAVYPPGHVYQNTNT